MIFTAGFHCLCCILVIFSLTVEVLYNSKNERKNCPYIHGAEALILSKCVGEFTILGLVYVCPNCFCVLFISRVHFIQDLGLLVRGLHSLFPFKGLEARSAIRMIA